VSRDDARAIAKVLLGDEMFGGYGVRTMGEREGGYNPVSYHDGSVWPHDSALILAGLVRYGLSEEAARLAGGLLAALAAFPQAQPPELFCGHPAAAYGTPVRYPTACRPQAWASGAAILLVRSVLGLEVDALDRVVAVSPLAIPGMTRLDVRGIPAGGERLDVSVRVRDGKASAELGRLPHGWTRVEPEQARI
jgi:glycogen debranching enzyme